MRYLVVRDGSFARSHVYFQVDLPFLDGILDLVCAVYNGLRELAQQSLTIGGVP